jgi:hypothetical protein
VLALLVHWRIRLSTPVPADWHYFLQGAHLLFHETTNCSYVEARHAFRICPPSPDGLHTFAGHPNLQIGPLALILVRGLLVLGEGPAQAIIVALSYALPAYLLWRGTRVLGEATTVVRGHTLRQADLLLLTTGPLVILSWAHLSSEYLHVDDMLVLLAAVLAIELRLSGHHVLMGVALGMGVASKPTALGLLPLAVGLPWRQLVRAALATLLVTAAAWGPFEVADRGTLTQAGSFIQFLHSGAPLALVLDRHSDLSWLRPVQLALMLIVGCVVAWRASWMAAPAAAFAVRVAMDPGDFSYYGASVVVCCVIYEIHTGMWFPKLTAPTYAMFFLAPTVLGAVGVTHALTRLLACLTPLVIIAASRGHASAAPTASGNPRPA